MNNELEKAYSRMIGEHPLLTREEETALGKRISKGDRSAVEKLVLHNLRLSVHEAKKYKNRGVDLMDLVQEGNLGLIAAAERFDHRLGYKFSTYATWWVRRNIIKAILDTAKTVRVPGYLHAKARAVEKARMKLSCREWPATPEEVAEEAGVSVKQVGFVDTAFPPQAEPEWAEEPFIEPELNPMLEEGISLDCLNERETRVITMRFGLDGHKPMTLQSLGDVFHLTKEGVRFIERGAIKKLKRCRLEEGE